MAAGDLTAILDTLSPEDFAATCVDLDVPMAAPEGAEDASLEEEGAEAEPESEDTASGGVPTAEELSVAAQAAHSEAIGCVDEMAALAENVGDVNKGAGKKIGKLVDDAEKLLKDAEKASEAAQKAAEKEDLGAAAEAAGEAETAARAIEELKVAAFAESENWPAEPEEGTREVLAKPAAAKGPPKVSPAEAWASR